MVTTTIVAGKVLMKDRELVTLDEARIAARARELSPKVWKRYQDKFKIMNDPSILLTIAVLGGTGKEGKGLAYRLGQSRVSGLDWFALISKKRLPPPRKSFNCSTAHLPQSA